MNYILLNEKHEAEETRRIGNVRGMVESGKSHLEGDFGQKPGRERKLVFRSGGERKLLESLR